MHLRTFSFIDRSTSLLAALAVAAIVIAGCTESVEQDTNQERPPRPVEIGTTVAIDAMERVRFPGVVRSVDRASLSFLQSGYLAERRVERGDRVESGEVIAVLFNPALQPGVAAARGAVAEAETRLAQLERDTVRLQRLVERELVATDQLEQVRAQRDAARAALDQALARRDEAVAQLEEAGLRAPFAGRVADVLLEPGDFAAVGQPIVELAGRERLEVEVRLPAQRAETLIGDLPPQPLRRVVDGKTAEAELREIGQAAPGRTAPVILDVDPASGFAPGDPVEVTLDFESNGGVAVPLTAVINPGTTVSRVIRVRDGRAETVAVQVGRLQGRYVTVFGDLAADDPIVVSGHTQLLDGEPVRVLQ